MSKTQSVFIFFIVTNKEEQIMTWPDSHHTNTPLVYFSHEGVLKDKMKESIRKLAKEYNLYCELREYQLVPQSEEKFYPDQTQYNA